LPKPCGGFSIPVVTARLPAISTNCAKLSIAWKPTRICSQTGSTGEHSTVNCGCWPEIVGAAMICKIQVVTLGEDDHQETREIARLQRTDLKPETLGLTLAEGKMIPKDLQQILVEGQVASFLLPKRPSPECGQPRYIKGHHSLSVRTVFGQLTVRSPRLHHCACRPRETKMFSPLAELLPNRTLPELPFLETKWASLMSYGMTSDLLARGAADRRARQYIHDSPARHECCGALGAGTG
jgi:hypothetical protein